MTQELHYTSLPRGLKPGSRGFCTVGSTPRMAGQLAERLESLSGYVPVYPVHDAAASRNPINFMHLKVATGGKSVSVLSRIGPANLDYSGRTNNYAHHVVLEANERAGGGPAWALSQPGFLKKAWEGEPRELPEGIPAPAGDRPAGVARAWHTVAGDAGWAGVLAESFLADPKRPAILVFRPGMELLPLFVEAIALVPPTRRWDVEFSTYFTTLPQGVNCPWRGVLEGSAEAESLLRLPNALVLNLCRPGGRAVGRALVDQARTGESPESASTDAGASNATPPSRGEVSARDRRVPPAHGREGGFEINVSHESPGARARPPSSGSHSGARRNPARNWAIAAGIVTVCLTGLATATFFLLPGPDAALQTGDSEPQAPKPNATPLAAPGAAESGENAVARAAQEPEAIESSPTIPDSAKQGERTKDEAGSSVATVPTPVKTEGEHAKSLSDVPSKEVVVATPKSKVPEEGDPAVSKAQPLTGQVQPKALTQRNAALKFDLKEPSLKPVAKDGPGAVDPQFEPEIIAGARITKLALAIPSSAKEADSLGPVESPNLTLKWVQSGNDTLRVTVDGLSGLVPIKNQPVAHFIATNAKIAFDWDKFGLESKNRATRDLLRNCLLEITTDKKQVYYALLRKRPKETEYSDPLRIRKKSEETKRREKFYPLHGESKLDVEVAWDKPPKKEYSYNYLSKRMVILEIKVPPLESTVPSLESKDITLVKDETDEGWVWKLNDVGVMKATINPRNEIQFDFLTDPYELSAKIAEGKKPPGQAASGGESAQKDAVAADGDGQKAGQKKRPGPQETLDLIGALLDADYSMILGFKTKNGDVELARIGSFAEQSSQ